MAQYNFVKYLQKIYYQFFTKYSKKLKRRELFPTNSKSQLYSDTKTRQGSKNKRRKTADQYP